MKLIPKLIAYVIVLATAYWSFNNMMPSGTEIADKNFSIDNALHHLKNISKKTHHVGTQEHKVVQDYLVNELKKLGLNPEIQKATAVNDKWNAATTAENIIARYKGKNSNGKALVLLSHYDSNPHSAVGASDAGSGVVSILEGFRAFIENNPQPKNDIIILFTDAEELGLLGAKAFVDNHKWVKDIGLVLNFEARGSGGPSFMLMETNGKNRKLLSEFIKANPTYPAANSLMYAIYKKLPNDTDLTVFRENANINGFNFAFIGDHFDYHTEQDTYERLDRNTLAHQADYLMQNLKHFAYSDLTNLNSEQDDIYVNFPIIKLISYPFAWVLPMLLLAILAFVVVLVFGLKKQRLTMLGIGKGFLAYSIAFVLAVGISFGAWEFLQLIHPQYADMLNGFTYNGYTYIAAFVCLNITIVLAIYRKFKKLTAADLLVAPIAFGLLINYLVYTSLTGAGFLIIPVYTAILCLAILVFMDLKPTNRTILFAIISIPAVYIFAPMLKIFPVALGLKILFITGILIVLLLGYILPVFHQQNKKSYLVYLTGILTLFFLIKASFNSGYTVDRKQPNSLVYINNFDTKEAFWGTYNKSLDSYTQQVFKDDYKKGGIPNTESKSKYNTHFTYHKKAKPIQLTPSIIFIKKDTVINNLRELSLQIAPQRKINKYELFSQDSLAVERLLVNGKVVNEGKPMLKKGSLAAYFLGNSDEHLEVDITIKPSEKLELILNEISFDLLENPQLNIQPRAEDMMPMPFITNDAIISARKLSL